MQGRARRAVGPTEGQDVVEPLLEQRRAGEPVHGVLQDDAVSAQQGGLLGGHIDVEVGVDVVHVAHGDIATERLRGRPEGLVDPRLGDVGVEDENESVHGGLPGVVGLRCGGHSPRGAVAPGAGGGQDVAQAGEAADDDLQLGGHRAAVQPGLLGAEGDAVGVVAVVQLVRPTHAQGCARAAEALVPHAGGDVDAALATARLVLGLDRLGHGGRLLVRGQDRRQCVVEGKVGVLTAQAAGDKGIVGPLGNGHEGHVGPGQVDEGVVQAGVGVEHVPQRVGQLAQVVLPAQSCGRQRDVSGDALQAGDEQVVARADSTSQVSCAHPQPTRHLAHREPVHTNLKGGCDDVVPGKTGIMLHRASRVGS